VTGPGDPRIVGIVNVTADSFSDGGRYLEPAAALAHAHALVDAGADVVELGAASSNPDAAAVPPAEEMRRLAPLLGPLVGAGVTVGVDTWQPATQRWAIAEGATYLNDIQGFPDPALDTVLAAATCRLIVMHSVQRRGAATRTATDPAAVAQGIDAFFGARLARLEAAGIARARLIFDPGMGHFLGSDPAPSLQVLRDLPRLRARFGVPVLVSVSRKSFLGALTGRPVDQRGPATLAAELHAAALGVDYVRTHDVAALAAALAVRRALVDG
jgi:dihydropteroate synthase type 2